MTELDFRPDEPTEAHRRPSDGLRTSSTLAVHSTSHGPAGSRPPFSSSVRILGSRRTSSFSCVRCTSLEYRKAHGEGRE